MTESFDPYAPPQADPPRLFLEAGGPAAAWRLDGERLAIRKGTVLPPICLWDGEPTTTPRIRRKLTWVPPWARLLAISPIIFLIVYLIVRKTGEFDYALGTAARTRRRNGIALTCTGIVMALSLTVAASLSNSTILLVVAIPFFFGAVAAAVWGRTVRLAKIDKEFIYLKLPPAAAAAFERLEH